VPDVVAAPYAGGAAQRSAPAAGALQAPGNAEETRLVCMAFVPSVW
jgi:hypothetical protein